jgi:O-antigen/teichoic acid export membrane protein
MPFVPPEAQRPARQASVLMFVLCGLALLAAMMFLMSSFIPPDKLPPDTRDRLEQAASQSGLSISASLQVTALMVAIPGVIVGLLGIFVRGGRMVAIAMSIVLDALLLAMTTIATLAALFGGGGSGNVLASCPFLGAAVLMAFLMVRLIAAAKAAKSAKASAAQYQLQYWQNYQWDQNSGYGYTAGPPPPERKS